MEISVFTDLIFDLLPRLSAFSFSHFLFFLPVIPAPTPHPFSFDDIWISHLMSEKMGTVLFLQLCTMANYIVPCLLTVTKAPQNVTPLKFPSAWTWLSYVTDAGLLSKSVAELCRLSHCHSNRMPAIPPWSIFSACGLVESLEDSFMSGRARGMTD